MIDVFMEVVYDLKATRQTELAWCKCGEGCMCIHCKPHKINLARKQLAESLVGEDLERAMRKLEWGQYFMRNQTHTLSKSIIAQIKEDLKQLDLL